MNGLPPLLAALLLLPCAAAGAAPSDREIVADELRAVEDPTIFKRRIWLDTEWNSFKDSGSDIDLTLGGVWAWALSARHEWAVRIKVPVSFHVPGDTAGDSSRQGLGDLKLATGTAVRLSETRRAAVGIEMRFPTGTHDFGDHVWRPMVFGALAWDATPWLTLSPSVEYNKSVAEDHGATRQHFMEMFFPATFLLPDRWAATPRYEFKTDFEQDNRVTHSAKLSVSRQLERVPLGLTLSIKKTFDGGDKRFQLNFVVTHYVR